MMNSEHPFPAILLDDLIGDQRELSRTPCDHVSAGRVWNIFDQQDLQALSIHRDEKNPVLRIYDLALLESLADKGLDQLPVILSHLIDLSKVSLPDYPAGIAIEVANRHDLKVANQLDCALVIGRSFEAPGPSKECSAFIIYQLLKAESQHPFYIHGATGYALFQAYLAMGVAGIVLSADQLSDEDREKTVRFSLGDHAIMRLAFAGGTPEAIAYREVQQEQPLAFLKSSFEQGFWTSQKGDLWAGEWKSHVLEYLKLYQLSPREIVVPSCFAAASPAAQKVGSRYPILQGAMANITLHPDFAEAVAKEGALPCLALAGVAVERAVEIVRETAARGFPFAVNFVALSLSVEDLESLIVLFEETRPSYVVISTPQLDHVNRLLKTDLELVVHAPNRAMFRVLYDMGCRNFIVEGEEAGGHTSNIGGLSAWQGVLEEIRDGNLQDKVHLVFAGGIRDRRAADLLATLLYFYGLEKDLMVSLQMGTAYLCTSEAMEFTGLPEAYRQTIIEGEDTVITGESVHRNVRQMATSHSDDLLAKEWSIFSSDLELEEKKQAYEKLYRGGLKLAVESDKFEEDGSYMAGAVSTLISGSYTIRDLHRSVLQEAVAEKTSVFEPIAIVGIGTILPGAKHVAEHFDNLLLKRCFITDTPDEIWSRHVYLDPESDESDTSYSGIAGLPELVDTDLTDFRIPPSVSDEMSQLQIVALKCAQQALDDAGYDKRPFPKSRVGAVIGAAKVASVDLHDKLVWRKVKDRLESLIKEGGEGEESSKELLERYDEEFNQFEITADTILGGNPSLAVSRLASVFDFQGLTNAIDAACSSSLAAIGSAIALLHERRCDVVISGGVGTGVGVEEFVGFSRIQALSSEGSFPFDERADGFVIGAGGALFVLKRYDDAIRNGDEIYALIRGWGAANDGKGKGIAAPDFEGQTRCLKEAYRNSGIDPSEVDYLECHATGTPVGDAEELKTVAAFFGEDRLDKNRAPLAMGGSKAMTGHVRSGAGAVGMLSGIFAINQRCVPAQVNFEKAPEAVDFEKLGLHVAKRPEVIDSKEVMAGISSFGFGGINYHTVLSSSPKNQRAALLDLAKADFPMFDGLSSDLAYVFPGQGSQFVGMLHEFKGRPEVAHLFAAADEIFERIAGRSLSPLLLDLPSTDSEVEQQQQRRILSTEVSQPAIFLSSVVMLEWLRHKGRVAPGLVLGHSLGEYAALYAAGILGFEDAFTLVCMRGQLMSASRAKQAGAMIAIEGGERAALRLIEQAEGYAVCANLNEYRQTVISGEKRAIDEIEKLALDEGMKAFPLNVSRAFHSKLVGDCVEPIQKQLQSIDFRQSNIPVLACLSRECFPVATVDGAGECMGDDDRVKMISLLGRQIDHPVDFISQINAAYENGIRRFVELGPKGTLSRLIDQILENKPLQTIFLNQADTDTLEQMEALPEKLQQAVRIKRQPLPVAKKARKPKKKKNVVESLQHEVSLNDQILHAVADISGYEVKAIDKDAEFERDLGIDTLKIFEILSRLRGEVLPQEIENFRELTSVQKILTVAEGYAAKAEVSVESKGESKIGWYKHKMVQTATFSSWQKDGSSAAVQEFGIDRIATPYRGDEKQVVVIRPLSESLASTAEELLPELHQKIVDLAKGAGQQEGVVIHVITFCPPEQFYDGAFFAVEAMLKVAQLDVPEIEFSYLHLDGDDVPDLEISQLLNLHEGLPATGKHLHQEGDITQGRLFPLDGLFGSEGSLPHLLGEEDVVLITGGARGIAAGIAQHLIKVSRARFILLGRKLETEQWIEALPKERVSYVSADLNDADAIRALHLEKENITLLIHAAGIEVPANLVKKTPEEFALTLATKALSLDHLLGCLDARRLRGVVQFSSIAAYRGNYGQADYAAANALLNAKLAGDVPALSIAWPAWSEVGMASRGVIKEILETSGAAFITPEDGLQVFEKLLTGFLMSPPRGTTRFVASGKLAGPYMVNYPGEGAEDIRNPFSHYRLSDPDQKIRLPFKVDLERFPSLREHHFYGKVFIPAAVMLRAMVRQVLADQRHSSDPVGFSDIEFLSPIALAGEESLALLFSRQNDFFLVEMEEAGAIRPIVSLKLHRPLHAGSFVAEDLALLVKMRKHAALRATDFPIHRLELKDSEESSFRGTFATLNELQYNGFIVTATVDMSLVLQGSSILTDTGCVPLLLEAAFQTASHWKQFGINTRQSFMPKHVGRCTINHQACAVAKEATVYCQFVKIDEVNLARSLNIIVVNEDDEVLIVLRDFVTSPTAIREPLCIHTIPKGVPMRMRHCDLISLPLQQASQYVGQNEGEIITAAEGLEIKALNSDKRREEKFAGKLACKLLAKHVEQQSSDEATQRLSLGEIEVLSQGTPVSVEISGGAMAQQGFYSISHSGGLVCAARGDHPVGVDIEKIRPLSDKMVRDCCGETLQAAIRDYIATGDFSEDDRAYLQQALPILIFTQKEAVLKAVGIGIGEGLSEVQIDGIYVQTPFVATFRGVSYEVISTQDRHYVLSVANLLEGGGLVGDEVTEVPLSFLQQAMVPSAFDTQHPYTLALRIQFDGKIDSDVIGQAFEIIIQRHEVLRMVFSRTDGELAGGVVSRAKVGFEVNRVAPPDALDSEQLLQVMRGDHQRAEFDLRKGPLFEATIFSLNENQQTLQIIFDHLIIDCYSALILAEELAGVCRQMVKGGEPSTTASTSYADFVARESEAMTAGRLQSLRNYWSKTLSGLLPYALPIPSVEEEEMAGRAQVAQQQRIDFAMDSAQMQRLNRNCRQSGVTLFAGLISAIQSGLAKYSGQNQSLLHVPFSARDRVLDKGATGTFIRMLPVRARFAEEMSYEDLLKQQRAAIFDAIGHAELPPVDMNEIIRNQMGGEISPMVICQLIEQPSSEQEKSGLEITSSVHDGDNPHASMVITFFQSQAGMRCVITLNQRLIARRTADELLRFCLVELGSLCGELSRKVGVSAAVSSDQSVTLNPVCSGDDEVTVEYEMPIQSGLEREPNYEQVVDQVVVIWQYVLKGDYQMNADVDFFALGGGSLQAVEIVTQLEQVFGVEVPLASFVGCSTPALQANLIYSQD
ncbi:MAG: SDR family NAD(P)-dependent oxidoreductase [Verrucomicrobiales bacterium]|nr:SDR family NAD(P)-dependent oxidoreductase [Verrucomicrobiales bacterium]